MIRRSKEKISVRKPAPFDGVGEITVRSLLNGPEEMSQKGRVFGHTTVYPGSEIGYHIHNGDSETYYILSGKGRYNDNGTIVENFLIRMRCMIPKTSLMEYLAADGFHAINAESKAYILVRNRK